MARQVGMPQRCLTGRRSYVCVCVYVCVYACAGQLGLGDGKDHWTPAQVMRIHTTAARFYDLRMPFVKPWKALQVQSVPMH